MGVGAQAQKRGAPHPPAACARHLRDCAGHRRLAHAQLHPLKVRRHPPREEVKGREKILRAQRQNRAEAVAEGVGDLETLLGGRCVLQRDCYMEVWGGLPALPAGVPHGVVLPHWQVNRGPRKGVRGWVRERLRRGEGGSSARCCAWGSLTRGLGALLCAAEQWLRRGLRTGEEEREAPFGPPLSHCG